jgi:hypothetical protein
MITRIIIRYVMMKVYIVQLYYNKNNYYYEYIFFYLGQCAYLLILTRWD